MGDNTQMPYSTEKAEKICALILEGYTVKDICAMDGMPAMTTFFRWLRVHDEFAQMYTQAKEEQAEIFVQDMVQIADDGRNDYVEKERKDGSTYIALDNEHVQRSRLRIDTRKWLASKFKAKKYGDRMIHAGDEDAPLITQEVSKNEKQAFERFVKNYNKKNKTQDDDDYDDIC